MCVSGNGLLATEAADDNGRDSVPREVTWCPQSLCSADVRDTVGGPTSHWIPLRANQRLGDPDTSSALSQQWPAIQKRKQPSPGWAQRQSTARSKAGGHGGWNGQEAKHLRRQRHPVLSPEMTSSSIDCLCSERHWAQGGADIYSLLRKQFRSFLPSATQVCEHSPVLRRDCWDRTSAVTLFDSRKERQWASSPSPLCEVTPVAVLVAWRQCHTRVAGCSPFCPFSKELSGTLSPKQLCLDAMGHASHRCQCWWNPIVMQCVMRGVWSSSPT